MDMSPTVGVDGTGTGYMAWPQLMTVPCFLQIMIEFCPGGAVDAIMLGKSFFSHWGYRTCSECPEPCIVRLACLTSPSLPSGPLPLCRFGEN